MPLNPNHAYCAFLSVGVSLAGPNVLAAGSASTAKRRLEALEFLRRLAGTSAQCIAH